VGGGGKGGRWCGGWGGPGVVVGSSNEGVGGLGAGLGGMGGGGLGGGLLVAGERPGWWGVGGEKGTARQHTNLKKKSQKTTTKPTKKGPGRRGGVAVGAGGGGLARWS